MNSKSFIENYQRELRRIGLDFHSSPYGMLGSGSDEASTQFVAHLRALPIGATWRDVFPDIPKHWDLDDDATWTQPYRPLGPCDYQMLPCGPAMLLRLPHDATDVNLKQLTADIDHQKCSVYGSWFVATENPDFPHRLAYIVLDIATTDLQYFELTEWLEQYPGVDVAGLSRPVGTQFAPAPSS